MVHSIVTDQESGMLTYAYVQRSHFQRRELTLPSTIGHATLKAEPAVPSFPISLIPGVVPLL